MHWISHFSLHVLHLMKDLVIICHDLKFCDLCGIQDSREQVICCCVTDVDEWKVLMTLMLMLMIPVSLDGVVLNVVDCRLLQVIHDSRQQFLRARILLLIEDLQKILIIRVGVEDDSLRRHWAPRAGVWGSRIRVCHHSSRNPIVAGEEGVVRSLGNSDGDRGRILVRKGDHDLRECQVSWVRGSPGEVRKPLIIRCSGIEVGNCSPSRRGTSADDSLPEDRDIELRVKLLTRTRSLGRGVQMMTAGIIVLARENFWSREKSVLNIISGGLITC